MNRKIAFLTGSSSGIGKRVCYDLAGRGYDLVMNYRSAEEETERHAELVRSRFGVQVLCTRGDVSDPAEVERSVAHAVDVFGRIDILIHNAGPFIFEYKKLVDYSLSEWQTVLNGNLSSAFYLARNMIPLMRQNRWGRIITYGFNQAETAPPWVERAAYAAAKSGLVSLTRTLALEEAEHGITVNMICPGDIIQPWKELGIAEARSAPNNATPIGRTGSGEDISRVIAFLCDEKSDFITGAVIPVTGGKTSFI